MSKRILFFGNERLATGVESSMPTLRALLDGGYEVPAIVVAQNQMAKSRRERQLEVAAIAQERGIPLLSPARLTDASDQLAAYGAEAAILIAYGKIVPAAVLDLFPRGIINVHPSLLPRHRGPSPIESAILDGDRETGVSLMRLAAKMDTGPVYAQAKLPLNGNETKRELADRLADLGAGLIMEYLPKVLDGSVEPLSQDENAATYDHLITKAAGQVDWTKPAVRLEREVRAYAGWPRSRSRLGSTDVIITAAHASDGRGQPGTPRVENKQLGVFTSDGLLVIDRLIPDGKKEMPAEAFLAGYTLT